MYSALYNSAGSKKEMVVLKEKIRKLLGEEDSRAEVAKLTPEVVKRAAAMMKPHKMDVSQGFNSVALLPTQDTLFGLLALVFQDWLIHITGSSLILRIFER